MYCQGHANNHDSGRSPHGERGLKFHSWACKDCLYAGRSPHGERGLKYRAPLFGWQGDVALLMESVD